MDQALPPIRTFHTILVSHTSHLQTMWPKALQDICVWFFINRYMMKCRDLNYFDITRHYAFEMFKSFINRCTTCRCWQRILSLFQLHLPEAPWFVIKDLESFKNRWLQCSKFIFWKINRNLQKQIECHHNYNKFQAWLIFVGKYTRLDTKKLWNLTSKKRPCSLFL
jgi:hypothetical protein